MTPILAAIVREPKGPFEMAELTLADPRPDEVLVRIAGVGICHTDLLAARGYFPLAMPAVLGHEGAGIVERVGADVTKFRPGDRVTMTFMSCGGCTRCRRDSPAYCDNFTKLNYAGIRRDGSRTLAERGALVSGSFFSQSSFASHALAHERNLARVPEGVPLDIVGVLGCGMQTGAGAVMRSLDCKPGRSLVVLGGGAVGLAAVMAAKVRDLGPVVVVEPHAGRRALALSLGAAHAIDPAGEPAAERIRPLLPGGADYVFDTTGAASAVAMVPQILARLGAFGFVGVPALANIDMPLPATLVSAMRNGWTFRGIIEGDSDVDPFLEQLMALHLAGRFPFDKIVTRYSLRDINTAIADQHAGRCTKPVLIP